MKSIGTACLDMIKKDDINNRPYVCYKHSMTFKNLAFFWVDIVLGNLLFKNKKKNNFIYCSLKISAMYIFKKVFEKLSKVWLCTDSNNNNGWF